jgi:PAS domain S-box-containing protein
MSATRMTPDVERLAALSTLSCDALVLVAATGHIEWVSPSMAALLGYGSDDLRGRRVDDLVEPDALEAWEAFVHHLETRPRVALRVQFRCRHRDGTSRWVEGTGQNLLGEPAVGAIVVRLRESTGRRASAATADPGDERTFRAMVEGSLVSVFIAQNDRLIYVNPTGAALLGYTVAELLELPNAFTLVHEQDRGYVIDQLAELGQPGTPTQHLTFRGRRKDGRVVQVEAFFAASEHHGQAATFGRRKSSKR